ncbi:MAG: indolepyruvate ferredoxin oxidoreductase family protein [Pseudomonadales bacterium]|jgi:indolepyruvate ferredoxin oxidoreductase|nr:indolepyruvate ferredoxin oxidoreductase family protein [Pseudomonadales bacterium]
MNREDVTLDDRYALESGQIILSGIQALVRLPLLQARRDRAAGLDTAGFVSGYRGSPLGGLDKALWEARPFLDDARIVFRPGVNEDLAATSVWGTQQVGLYPGAKHDGVFAMWYGKAPGVDRSCDAFRHANAAGTAPHGGVLLVAGDDHGCKSSTLPSQSEFTLMDLGIPVLNPANVQDVLDFGQLGWAMSRYAGLWVGLIALADTMDSTATVDAGAPRIIVIPSDFTLPPDGLSIRLEDEPVAQEQRLLEHKIPAAQAFARANDVNRLVVPAPQAEVGIVATGKAWLDVCQALTELGLLDDADVERAGVRLMKVGLPWPLDDVHVREFARGLDRILVVEEKRPLLEDGLRNLLYGTAGAPRILGKHDEQGARLLNTVGELSPAMVARAIAKVLPDRARTERIEQHLAFLLRREDALHEKPPSAQRQPLFCAGCPHNTSTKVPDGSRAMAGIGCHYMARWIEPHTSTFTQMGGEGTPWIGQSPFTETEHVFVNMGDGTYFHSGLLAIRAAVSAGVNVTYKILYNDAVAMTGGQHVDGSLSVAEIVAQLRAEGVERLEVVADDPSRHEDGSLPGLKVRHRDEMDALQRELRETRGCSVIVYDQVCATELRRRRKRGLAARATQRVLINELVCEGCGDCTAASNCVAVEPLPTEHGVKRTVNQSLCNVDTSCVKGFCPSFVTVEGAEPRRSQARGGDADPAAELPLPTLPELDDPLNIVITGVGGTGIVTVSQLLAMAAHLDGNAAVTLDMTGLAQKGGAVLSHVRICRERGQLYATRVAAGRADLLLACDLVTAGGEASLTRISPEHTFAVVNTHLMPTADFVLRGQTDFGDASLLARVKRHAGDVRSVDATGHAERLLGDAVGANLFALGYAWQLGRVPVSLEALLQAIELNGVAIAMNRRAFAWGRLAAAAPDHAAFEAGPDADVTVDPVQHLDLDALLDARSAALTDYQGPELAARYRERMASLRASVERVHAGGAAGERLLETAARQYARVLMVKDEFEVARLYSDGRFADRLRRTFEEGGKVSVHLAPPILPLGVDGRGNPRKIAFGPWMLRGFAILARFRRLRGSWLDPFRGTEDRRRERALIETYESLLDDVSTQLDAANADAAIRLLASAEQVRGFGPVRARNDAAWREALPALREAFLAPPMPVRVVEPGSPSVSRAGPNPGSRPGEAA